MRSPTQRELHIEDIALLIRQGLDSTVVNATELTGGGFAAVWRASLADGRDVVVKVGPPPGARLLGYERGLIAAEAEYFRLAAAAAPVPAVLAEGDGWLITSLLPGRPLTEIEDDAPVREQWARRSPGFTRSPGRISGTPEIGTRDRTGRLRSGR